MKFIKLENKYTLLWVFLFAAYGGFIFLFSYLFPLGADEYNAAFFPLCDLAYSYKLTFLELTPKIGALIGAAVLFCGRWLFLVLNPLMQLGLWLAVFYFIHLRLPDVKDGRDMPVMLLMLLLSVLAVATPDSTLFWSNGAMNYSWPLFFYMIALCYLRLIYEGRAQATGALKLLFLFIVGVISGTSNENNAPLAALICFLFWIFMGVKKRKMPLGFYALFLGVSCGMAIFFASPALINRAVSFGENVGADISEKLFWHIGHLDNFLCVNFYLPALSFLSLAVFAFDKDKRELKNRDYVMACLSLLLCFCAAGILFFAPEIGFRVYYSATVFSIAAFIFVLKYVKTVYRFNLARYFTAAAFIFGVVIAPTVVLPYFSLHRQEAQRWAALSRAKEANRTYAVLPVFIIPRTPVANYTIIYYEPIFRPNVELQYFYGINVYRAHPLPQNASKAQTAVLF